MTALAGRTHGQAPTAEAVIDGPDQAVLLDLMPVASTLLTDLGRALFDSKETWVLRALGNVDPTSREHTEYLRRLTANARVTAALQVLISTTAANTLAEQLDGAALTVDECARTECDNLAGHDGLLCDGHHDAATRLPGNLRSA